MKKTLTYCRLAAIVAILLAMLAILWIGHAVVVDFNGVDYMLAKDQGANFGTGIQDMGDRAQQERQSMQQSENPILAFAARLPFWGRLIVTVVLAGTSLLLFQGIHLVLRKEN